MRKKSEAILDFILAFIGVAVLTLGIARIWAWFNINYAGQQVTYQNSRLYAGSPKQFLPTAQQRANESYRATYPNVVGTAASTKCADCWHKPLDLTNEWVFKGTPGGNNTYGGLGLARFGILSSVDCEAVCTSTVSGDVACGNAVLIDEIDPVTHSCVLIDDPDPNNTHSVSVQDPAHPGRWITRQVPNKICRKIRDPAAIENGTDTFNADCPCFVHCDCNNRNTMTLNALKTQVYQLCGSKANYVAYIDWQTGIRNPSGNPRPNPINSDPVTQIRVEGCGGVSTYTQGRDGSWTWSDLPSGKDLCNTCGGYATCSQEAGDDIGDSGVSGLYDEYGTGTFAPWCGQYCQLCKNAAGMEDAASDCCDPWDLCWWFTWGKACDPLKKAAAELRKAAKDLADEGRRLQYEIYKIEECCNEPKYDTLDLQNACFEGKALFDSCGNMAGVINDINATIRDLTGAKIVAGQSIVRDGCRNFLHNPLNETKLDTAWRDLYNTKDAQGNSIVGTIDTACKIKEEVGYSLAYSHLNYKWTQVCDCGDCTDSISIGGCAAAPLDPGNQCLARNGKTWMSVSVPKIKYDVTIAVTASGTTPICVWSSYVSGSPTGKSIDWTRIVNASGMYDDAKTKAPASYITCMNNAANRSPYWVTNVNNKILDNFNDQQQQSVTLTKVWLPNESNCILQGALTGMPLLGAMAQNCGIASIWRCLGAQVGKLWGLVHQYEQQIANIKACCAGKDQNRRNDPNIPDLPPAPATIADIKNNQCNIATGCPPVVSGCDSTTYTRAQCCTYWQNNCVNQVIDQLQKDCVVKAQQAIVTTSQSISCSHPQSGPVSDCDPSMVKVSIDMNAHPCYSTCAATSFGVAQRTVSGNVETYCVTVGQWRCYNDCVKNMCAETPPSPVLPALVTVKVKETDACGVDCAKTSFVCTDYTTASGFRAYDVSQVEANEFWTCYPACPLPASQNDRPCGGCGVSDLCKPCI